MREWFIKKCTDFIFSIFMFSGKKIFNTVTMRTKKGEVLVVHFAVSGKELNDSCVAMVAAN